VILGIEKHELGISAGLQDRVIQTYGGLVHMDFTPPSRISTEEGQAGSSTSTTSSSSSRYTELSTDLLPKLYLIYNTNAGARAAYAHIHGFHIYVHNINICDQSHLNLLLLYIHVFNRQPRTQAECTPRCDSGGRLKTPTY
jgi:hypothetical protein